MASVSAQSCQMAVIVKSHQIGQTIELALVISIAKKCMIIFKYLLVTNSRKKKSNDNH